MVEYSNVFVVMMGMGVVFFGLISIVVLTMLMGKVLQTGNSQNTAQAFTGEGAQEPETGIGPELFAVITSVLSEDAETTPFGLNIVDIRKI